MLPAPNLNRNAWGAIILAGGQSRRMGTDKGALRLNGVSFVERLVTTFQSVAVPIILVAKPQSPELSFADGIQVLCDQRENAGPLEGIRVGLAALEPIVEFAFVIGCDSPLLKIEFVQFLLRTIGSAQAAVPRDETEVYGTTAAYRTDLHWLINQQLDEGQHSIKQMLQGLDVNFISTTELRSIDPDLRSLLNVNTPEDYSRVVDWFS